MSASAIEADPPPWDPTAGGVVRYQRLPVHDGQCAALLSLNRPEQLNAIDWETLRALRAALDEAVEDRTVRAVLVTGRGRAFCAGGDIRGFVDIQADPVAFPQFVDAFIDIVTTIRTMDKPVIALVNGICAAGGLELLLACDFAWAAQSARLGDLHLNYAQIGGAGAMTLLPRLIGPARARELIFSGRLLSSDEALEWGLVNRVLPDADLLDEAIGFVRGIASKSPAAVGTAKHLMNSGTTTDLDSALRHERATALLHCLTLPDSMEGITAFVEKREPHWPVD
jgi:enoyl-CoA hydratase/carnithine racemase